MAQKINHNSHRLQRKGGGHEKIFNSSDYDAGYGCQQYLSGC